jgi:hypothetical protein
MRSSAGNQIKGMTVKELKKGATAVIASDVIIAVD